LHDTVSQLRHRGALGGSGQRYAKSLQVYGIHKVLELQQADVNWVMQRVAYELREQSCLPMELTVSRFDQKPNHASFTCAVVLKASPDR
jgi:hypothetical protein